MRSMWKMMVAMVVWSSLSAPAHAGAWEATVQCEPYDFGLFSFWICDGTLAWDSLFGG